MLHRILRICVTTVLIGIFTWSIHVEHAQSSINLTLGLYNTRDYSTLRSRLDQFESTHPNIKVSTVDLPYINTKITVDPAKHLNEIAKLASAADVLQITPNLLTESDSRTNYFLNLNSYTDEDRTFNKTDYYLSAWQSWNWDNILWGIPSTIEPIVMQYNPTAFDNAGLSYPSGNWQVDDLSKAIRKLTVKNAQGSVTQPALGYADSLELYESLIGAPLYDQTLYPNPPAFNQAAIDKFLQVWSELYNDGLLNPSYPTTAPMQITTFHNLFNPTNANHIPAVSLIPGGRAGLIAWGYSVSSGTQYPQQAYELGRFLADSPDINQLHNAFSARQDQGNIEIALLTPDQQSFVHQALDKAIPYSELRYTEYIDTALSAINSGSSIADALQTSQSQAESALQLAMLSHNIIAIPITVATTVPKPSPQAGKITLKFGVATGLVERNGRMTLTDQSSWDAIATEFSNTDAEVSQIILDPSFDPIGNQDDCFYQSAHSFSSSALSYLLPIDPLTENDPTFSTANFVGTVLSQSTYNGKLWAYPLNIQPSIITYDPKVFNKAGIPLPINGWTITQFIDAVKQLHAQSGDAAFAMTSSRDDDLPLLILIAAYGGMPINYRVDPPVLSFTDPANVDAIRQVLDLAKAGDIQYLRLNDPAKLNPSQFGAPIQTGILSADSFHRMAANQSGSQVTTFPTGTHFSGLAYNIGSVALNAITPYTSACYRWTKVLEQHPELFQAMPIKRSSIDDPNLVNSQGKDLVALYQRITQQLDNQNTIPFPAESNGHTFSQFIVERWLYEAFDQYVFDGVDLKTALSQSQDWAVGFNTCIASVPPYKADDTQNLYIQGIRSCAIKFDPTIASIFPPS